ncbi:hypothetical protein IT413_00740 [Candidatus Peregrinibacteria bacterium]|nr:hypothetical protein [Candidatus Peregrinibacteria bacterium]
MTPEIHDYLKQLLVDAGQTDLGTELEETMIQDLATRLEDRLTLAAVEKLPQDKQEELTNLAADKENAKQVMEFLQKNIPDYDEVFAQALADFREIYLGAQS